MLKRFYLSLQPPILGVSFQRWVFSALALLLLAPHPAFPAALMLSECLARIEGKSVQIAQSVLNQAKAEAALKEANSLRLPQLIGQGNLFRSNDLLNQTGDANKLVFRVEQNAFPLLGPAWSLGSQRRAELEVASLATVESVQDVQLLVKQLYFSILRDEDSVREYNRVESELNRLLSFVIPRFDVGNAPPFDSVKVKSSILDLARFRYLIEAQIEGEKSQLRQLIGLPQRAPIALMPLTALPPIPGIQPDEESLLENPTLKGLRLQVSASEQAVKTAQYARIPTLTAAVELGELGQTWNTVMPGWNMALQLRLVLFDWGTISSQVSQVRASVSLAEKKVQAETERTQTDVIQTRTLAQAHFSDHQRLVAMFPETRRSAMTLVDRYRKAASGIVEVSDGIGLWLQNLLNERSSYYAYLADIAKLERLSGGKAQVRYE